MLKDNKRVNGAGAHLYIGEHSEYKFAQKQLKTKLATIPEFRNIFMEEVKDMLVTSLNDPNYVEIVDEEEQYDLSTDILSGINHIA